MRVQLRSLLWLGAAAAVSAPLFWSHALRGYQNERINAWLNPSENILGYNWDPHQARIAVGNGGWLGQGFMKGSQNQFLFLHEQHSDFPFPVYAEEWGFVGSLALVALYAVLVLWCVRIGSMAKDRFGAVLAVGVGSVIFWHAVFNLGMVTGLLPVVGVTLPLFSYGGSSAMTILIGVGLVMNVSMRRSYSSPSRTTPLLGL
jgi:rod shape determining protein RodA